MKKILTLVLISMFAFNGFLFIENESLNEQIKTIRFEQNEGLNEEEVRQIQEILEESNSNNLTLEELIMLLSEKLNAENRTLESALSTITSDMLEQELSLKSSLDTLKKENEQFTQELLAMISELDERMKQEIEREIKSLSFQELEDLTTSVVEQKINTVVGVSNEIRTTGINYQTSATGSGVIFHRDGTNYYVITNEHVIRQADRVSLVIEGHGKFTATVVGYDKTIDLALLKFTSNALLNYASFMDSNTLKQGEIVLAMGNPLGYTFYRSVTMGIVSGLSRTISVGTSDGGSYYWQDGVIQHDAAISPGNSGGPLFNLDGEIVGINNAMSVEENATNIGFAIPANTVIDFIQRYLINGFMS